MVKLDFCVVQRCAKIDGLFFADRNTKAQATAGGFPAIGIAQRRRIETVVINIKALADAINSEIRIGITEPYVSVELPCAELDGGKFSGETEACSIIFSACE